MADSEGSPIRVLIVDDEADLADLVSVHLGRIDERFEVETAIDGETALEHLETESFHCVVSDHDMPGMDGLDLLREIRAANPELPFILYTGKGSEAIASDAISAGVTDYLQKETGTEQYKVLANRIERAVTERRAKDALEESERQLSTLISNLPGMVYRCRNEHGWPMEFVSGAVEEMTGYTAEEIESGAVNWEQEVLYEKERDELWERVQVAVDAGEPFEVSYRIETRSGETRWMWERGRCVDEEGDILEGFITDITARKERERELEAIQKRYRTLIDTAPDAIFLADPDSGTILDANEAAADLLDRSKDEIVGMDQRELHPEAHKDQYAELFERHIEAGHAAEDTLPDGSEVEIVTRDGERVPVEVSASVVELADQQLIQGYFRDISERRERERRLERYRTLVENVGDPMYVLDAEGQIEMVNQAMADHLGYDRETLVGAPATIAMPEADVHRGTELIREVLDAEDRRVGTFEMQTVANDGTVTECEDHLAVLTEDGEFVGSVGVVRDISERKRREQRLEQFASVVSHDLKNPLNVVMGRIELAQETGDVSHLDTAEDAVDQMFELIDDLLGLARKGDAIDETYEVDVERIATDAAENVTLGETTVEVDLDLTVDADPDRFRELFENLFANAVRHAGADTIRVGSLADLDGTDANRGLYVADDGPGIPEDERTTVFEHGHTTAEDGTGFGLTIVENIVRGHDWTIRIDESREGGARFEIETR